MHKRFITVDFSKKSGKLKPVACANQGPLSSRGLSTDFTDEFREMNIPYVRTHNVEYPYGAGRFVDIHCIFPDFDLDPNFELSYNFAPTDKYLQSVKSCGAEIYLRLGESSDEYEIAPYIKVPKDIEKWAKICEKIISHYNEGWCNGFKWGIKYCEIWSDADSPSGFRGTREEYFELYSRVAKHIKARFPRINVGAYSSGGFYSLNHVDGTEQQRRYIPYLEDFLDYITRKDVAAPLDFLSWKCYAQSPEELSLHSNYARSYLQNAGLKRTKSIVSEFNLSGIEGGTMALGKEYPAMLASSLIIAQKSGIDMMFYADMSPFSLKNGLFSLDDRITKRHYAAYEVMCAFGELYRLGGALEVSEDYRREIYTLAAEGAKGAAILFVARDYDGVVDIALRSCPYSSYSIKGMLGAGERGAGFSTRVDNIPINSPVITLKAGSNEIYLITFNASADS